jgi:spore coat polysaccharide biosynthesis protein SpsF
MPDNFAVISVRYSSTRLPHKAIKEICGRKTIEIVIDRAKMTGLPVVIATSTEPADDIFADIARQNAVEIFRGSLLNRLRRWKDCFDRFDIASAVLIDGDDLLHDPDIEARALDMLADGDTDVVKNPENIICSYFTLAMSRTATEKMPDFMLADDLDLDVITQFLCRSDLRIKEVPLNGWERDRPFRMTLDYAEDLAMFERLISAVGITASAARITEFLDTHPEIVGINLHRHKDFLDNQRKFNRTIDDIYVTKQAPVSTQE